MDQAVEQKVLETLLTTNHIILLASIFSLLLTLRWVKPVRKFLFSDKWKWLIAPVNLGLSCLGVFALGLTSVTGVGSKIAVAIIASALVTLTYEAIAKYVINGIEAWVKKKMESS